MHIFAALFRGGNKNLKVEHSDMLVEKRIPIISTKSKRRDTMRILAEILEISKEGTLKTQIMYRANLSFTQLNDYLNFMLNFELIAIKNAGGKTSMSSLRKA
jgi:predicted transcriptional regulator